MTAHWEVDLEADRIQFDGNWLSREDLSGRIQQMLASGNFKISRLSEALEYLVQAAAGARSLTFKLSAEQYARLEAAGQKLGKPAHIFGRDLLLQVLGGGAPAPVAAAAAPPVTITPAPAPAPVIAAPPAPALQLPDAATEEAAPALTITPKKKDSLAGASPVPPVMTPTLNLPTDGEEASKGKQGGPGDGRRWFNRS